MYLAQIINRFFQLIASESYRGSSQHAQKTLSGVVDHPAYCGRWRDIRHSFDLFRKGRVKPITLENLNQIIPCRNGV